MEIKKGNNKYYIGDSEEKPLAEMVYLPVEENLINIEHTYVSEELNGKGIGKLLLKEIIEMARMENKKIKPICPYAKAQMEKNEEYHSLIYK